MTAFTAPALFQNGTPASATSPSFTDYVYRGPQSYLADDLQLVSTRAGFDALEDEWNDLFERAGTGEQMFQKFNWLWHWANHFLPAGAGISIVTVRRKARLIAIVPLVVRRVAGLKQLEFMGEPVSQYGDAIAESLPDRTDVLSGAMNFAIARTDADLVRLSKVRDDAAMAPVMARLAAAVTASEEAPFIDLAAAGSWGRYEERFNSKAKRNRRRQERRMAEHGELSLDWTLAGDQAADAARTTLVLKRAWLKMRGQLSRAFADPRTDQFFAAACSDRLRPTGAHVSLLRSGGEIANASITVAAKGRLALHILAYGMKFEKCAPGALHVERLVTDAFEQGLTTLDFLAPAHDYKFEWADGSVRVADYALPVSLAGKCYTRIYLGFIREGLKSAAKSAPRALAAPLAVVQSALKRVRR